MKSIPYIEYTKLEAEDTNRNHWYHMSHLNRACASMDSHRTSAYAICLLSKGKLQLESDLFIHQAEAPAIFTIAPSAIRRFTDLGEGYEAKIFFFRKELFLEGQADINYLDKFDFFEVPEHQFLQLEVNQHQMLETYFNLIHEKTLEGTSHASDIIRSLIYILINELDSIYQSVQVDSDPSDGKNTHILSKFKSLLAEHFIEERQVSFYADKLHLTPKYFSTIIKEVSGKTAGEWINEMLVLEAKVRLQNQKQSIAQIAFDLNFSDASHFGKFFKKHVGISPSDYRK